MTLPPLPEGWQITHRESGIVEYTCPHGVGHPVARAVSVRLKEYEPLRPSEGVHGCDGCCSQIERPKP